MANENMIQKHVDNFLAKIAGETPIDDNPRNSTEFWLNEIAENLPGGGTTVIANPPLAGTEDPLTGLQVGDIKYKVPEESALYLHIIDANDIKALIVSKSNVAMSKNDFAKYLYDNGLTSVSNRYPGIAGNDGSNPLNSYYGFYASNATTLLAIYKELTFAVSGSSVTITPSALKTFTVSSITDKVIPIHG